MPLPVLGLELLHCSQFPERFDCFRFTGAVSLPTAEQKSVS